MILIFEVIVKITLLESDEPKLSLVVAFHEIESKWEIFLLTNMISIEEKDQLKACLKNRKKYVLKSIHFATNILDPVYNGINLKNDNKF